MAEFFCEQRVCSRQTHLAKENRAKCNKVYVVLNLFWRNSVCEAFVLGMLLYFDAPVAGCSACSALQVLHS